VTTVLNNQYTIVQEVKESYSTDIQFINRNSEKEVLHFIGMSANRDICEPDAKIARIIRMDEFGNVDFMEVVFKDGRLKLEAMPLVRG